MITERERQVSGADVDMKAAIEIRDQEVEIGAKSSCHVILVETGKWHIFTSQ
jgi:hypothetical protein